MKRAHALTALRAAGYHGDNARWTRVYIENRVSIPVANRMWREGAAARAAGVPCSCMDCAAGKVEVR